MTKIECWEQLDDVYLTNRGNLSIKIDNIIRVIYESKCKFCGEILISIHNSNYCNQICAAKYNNGIRKYCREKNIDPVDFIKKLHWDDELPILTICEKYGFHRNTLTKFMIENDIGYRTQSEEMKRRYNKMTDDEKKYQTMKANEKMRVMVEKGDWHLSDAWDNHPAYIDGRSKDRKFRNKYNRDLRQKLKESNPYLYKNYYYLSNYGIRVEDKIEMIEEQNNKCKICGIEFNENTRPVVDHCHTTGEIRGILCDQCNWMIGHARDNINYLKSAIKYLGA